MIFKDIFTCIYCKRTYKRRYNRDKHENLCHLESEVRSQNMIPMHADYPYWNNKSWEGKLINTEGNV